MFNPFNYSFEKIKKKLYKPKGILIENFYGMFCQNFSDVDERGGKREKIQHHMHRSVQTQIFQKERKKKKKRSWCTLHACICWALQGSRQTPTGDHPKYSNLYFSFHSVF